MQPDYNLLIICLLAIPSYIPQPNEFLKNLTYLNLMRVCLKGLPWLHCFSTFTSPTWLKLDLKRLATLMTVNHATSFLWGNWNRSPLNGYQYWATSPPELRRKAALLQEYKCKQGQLPIHLDTNRLQSRRPTVRTARELHTSQLAHENGIALPDSESLERQNSRNSCQMRTSSCQFSSKSLIM